MPAKREARLSFNAIADDYDLGRPTYPAALVEWALGTGPVDVLDVGAGTGKLTEVLVDAGHMVSAVEPMVRMAAVLRRRLPEVGVMRGTAEQLPFEARSFDAVVVGQAFHWFDQQAALDEFARVLRPGGTLAAFWNVYAGDADWLPYPRAVPEDSIAAITSHPTWVQIAHRAHAWDFEVDETRVLAFCRSHSSIARLAPRDRLAYSTQIASDAAAVAEQGALPLITHVWRGTRP
jgi:ubiquinone/menaquinone biosynthesis C-methylase UbiE